MERDPGDPLARSRVVVEVGGVDLGRGQQRDADAGPAQRNNNTSAKLREAVTAAGIMEHARALQDIGDANGTTRVSGSSGYDDSADYAMEVFRAQGAGHLVLISSVGDPASASASIASRSRSLLTIWPVLCGGRPAGTQTTRSRLRAARNAFAIERWPL